MYKGSHIFSFDGRPRPHDEVRETFPLPSRLLERAGVTRSRVARRRERRPPAGSDRATAGLRSDALFRERLVVAPGDDRPEMTNVQYFHRDTDDFRFLTLFIYLTDVGLDGGPHQVIPGSHTLEGMRELVRKASWWPRFDVERSFVDDMGEDFSRDVERLLGDTAASLTGKAGEMALVNTVALHRGLVPTRDLPPDRVGALRARPEHELQRPAAGAAGTAAHSDNDEGHAARPVHQPSPLRIRSRSWISRQCISILPCAAIRN